jgi:hypothetical protein
MPAKTLVEWNFDSPDDAWTQTINISDIAVKDGCLTGRTVDKDPSVAGPAFEIQASPWQFVEIRMRCTKDGHGELYYTNTTEEPYKGFRPDFAIRINYKAGDFQVYKIYPFWQQLGKIIRIRIDPPENSEFAIDYIKVLQLDVQSGKSAFFDFTRPGPHWISAYDLRSLDSANSIVTTEGENLFISPKVELNPDDFPWLSLMAKSNGVDAALLGWVTDKWPYIREYAVSLKPDNKWHVYNFPMEDVSEWAGKIQTLGIRVAPSKGQSVEVRFMGASTDPKGPAEIDIKNFGFKEAINRIGKPAALQATIINVGGQNSGNLKASLKNGKALTIPELEPSESRLLTWTVTPGDSAAELQISGKGIQASAKTTLHWYPAVNVKPASYVPEPKPVRGDFDVGMYYFPGWATYRQWAVLDEFPERRPILGYYREGDPEVADWQIKWMVEHGVTFIVYDWYWSAGGRQLEHGIHKAFFNARYHDKIKFCLLWANHNAPGTSSAEDMVNVTNYWLDNYFLRPDYFKVDGKPVVVIFSPDRFTQDMGVDGVRQAFEKSREMAKAKGLPGIYFVSCSVPNPTQLRQLEQEGYDALSGYNYPSAGDNGQWVAPYDDMVTGYQDIWNAIAENTKLRYIPITEPGWDSRPWHGPGARIRTGKTPEKFRQMLENAKQFVEKHNPDAKPKMILIEAWNEFGEGDYTEPHQEFGFGHVDAIREVFTNAPKEHEDIVPEDVGLGPYELEKPKPVTAWEFDDPKSPGWDPSQNLTGGKVEDGCLTTVSNGIDPAIYSGITEVQASKYPAIEIRMKVDKGKGAQLFWSPRGKGFVELASAKFDLIPDGEFHVYRLDLAANPAWKGTITAFRLDPTDAKDAHISLDYVRLISR